MRTPLGVFLFIATLLLLDLYVFQAVRTVSQSSRYRVAVYVAYWLLTIASVVSFLLFVYTGSDYFPKKIRVYLFALVVGMFLAKMTAFTFLAIDDLRRLVQWFTTRVLYSNTQVPIKGGEGISRSVFFSWLGLAAGGTLFTTLLYGFGNKYKYQVKRVKLRFPHLPASFSGLKVVHISDIHCGSLMNHAAVAQGVEMVNREKPDLILFTGDLVNDVATELRDLRFVFNKLQAPMGVYSVLGNHDYGDYVYWPYQGISKVQNLENLKQIQREMGWRLLMNEHVVFERDGEKIALLGIENWSIKARFPRYGKMVAAYPGTENIPFKILMSHDPSHWEGEVQEKYPDIDLMLSGHTHGMQFGLEIPGFKWSPVQYVYKQWKGLYEFGKQKLYVNPGFGFIGYPGRVGILPEITVIELEKS